MRKWVIAIVALLGIALVTSDVLAQRPGQGRGGQGGRGGQPGQGFGGRGGQGGFGGFGFGGRGGAMNPLQLLGIEQVQSELELIEEQTADIRALGERLRGDGNRERPNFQELSEEERRQLIEDMRTRGEEQAKEAMKGVEEILLPHQMDRLRQIMVQVQGINALSDPWVVEQLKVSKQQQDQIAAKMEENRETMGAQMRELFQGGGQGGDREALREKMQQLQKDANDKVLAVLSQSQQEQFTALKGKPFEMPQQGFGRGGRGGDGGGAQGGRGGRGGDSGRPRRPGGAGDDDGDGN